MDNRAYNILFHTHTVSGIVISVALFVIFFAGSFSFFRDEIVNWERAHTVAPGDELSVDVNAVLQQLGKNYSLHGRDMELRHYYNERQVAVTLGASKDGLAEPADKGSAFFYLDPETAAQATYAESYTLGEFLYRLHFFAQLPYPYGYYLSGFVAFFFLFAIVTGMLIHWKKIIPNFFLFRPKAKLKTLWTDAHTALGVIGFPFQFAYAVTGAFFMLKTLMIIPAVAVLYGGSEEKLNQVLEYNPPDFEYIGCPLAVPADVTSFVERTRERWPGLNLSEVHIYNYGDANMHIGVSGHLPYEEAFTGIGEVIYKVSGREVVSVKDPREHNGYLDGVKNVLYRLHLGDYGGYFLRIVSFFLGLIGCFVILSGVLLWQNARKKKNISEKRRRFQEGVKQWYLAICLSMYPVTAASFILVKAANPLGKEGICQFYFLAWLLLSFFFIIKKNAGFTNKYTLLSGGILGLMVPLANGFATGLWPWLSLAAGAFHVFFVDVMWVGLSVLAFVVYFKLPKGPGKEKAGGAANSCEPGKRNNKEILQAVLQD